MADAKIGLGPSDYDKFRSMLIKALEHQIEDMGAEIKELEAEVERLEKALEDVEGFLRNDKYDTRVRNALSVIDDALDG